MYELSDVDWILDVVYPLAICYNLGHSSSGLDRLINLLVVCVVVLDVVLLAGDLAPTSLGEGIGFPLKATSV
jgi:hypothetical protein